MAKDRWLVWDALERSRGGGPDRSGVWLLPNSQRVSGRPLVTLLCDKGIWDSADTYGSYGPRGKFSFRFSLTQWAKRKDVQQAWVQIAAQHDLVYKEIRDIERNFGFLDWALCQSEPFVMRLVD